MSMMSPTMVSNVSEDLWCVLHVFDIADKSGCVAEFDFATESLDKASDSRFSQNNQECLDVILSIQLIVIAGTFPKKYFHLWSVTATSLNIIYLVQYILVEITSFHFCARSEIFLGWDHVAVTCLSLKLSVNLGYSWWSISYVSCLRL